MKSSVTVEAQKDEDRDNDEYLFDSWSDESCAKQKSEHEQEESLAKQNSK